MLGSGDDTPVGGFEDTVVYSIGAYYEIFSSNMFTEKADFMEADQSKYYDGSALIDAPWFICQNEGVSFTYETDVWANEGCTDKCNLEVIAYVPDRITDPDAVYSG